MKICMKKSDAEKVFDGDSAYFVKSTPLRAFSGYFQHRADMLQTYGRCAWRSVMLKFFFWSNLQGF